MAAHVLIAISSMGMAGTRGTLWQKSIAAKEHCMRLDRQFWCWVSLLLSILIVLTGCAYDAAVQRLSLAEQSEWHIYNKVMTAAQARTYVAKPSAAERTDYLRHLGLVQRFEALDPRDREAIRSGVLHVGMSADALWFLWGEPYDKEGDARRSAHWHYLGSSLTLAHSGNRYGYLSNRVDVYLVDGKVVGWVEGPMPNDEQGGSDDFGS